MKTTYISMAILAMALSSQTAAAKLSTSHSIVPVQNKIEFNIEAEIVSNINEMLANLQAPTIKNDAAKQLNINTVQLQTNKLVREVGENLPEFKFKVILAD
jgi:hypothetical protein